MKRHTTPAIMFAILLMVGGAFALYQSMLFARDAPSIINDAGKAALAVLGGSAALTVGGILAFVICVDALTSRNQPDD